MNCSFPNCTSSSMSSISLNQQLQKSNLSNPRTQTLLRLMYLSNKGLYFPSPFLNYYFSMEKNFLSRNTSQKVYHNRHFLQMNFNKISQATNTFDHVDTSISQLMFPFCAQIDSSNKCTKCIDGFIDIKGDGVCHQVARKMKGNCRLFEKKGHCEVCERGYVLREGKCHEMEKFVSNVANNAVVKQYQDKADNAFVRNSVKYYQLQSGQIGRKDDNWQIIVDDNGNRGNSEENKPKTEENKSKNEENENKNDVKDNSTENEKKDTNITNPPIDENANSNTKEDSNNKKPSDTNESNEKNDNTNNNKSNDNDSKNDETKKDENQTKQKNEYLTPDTTIPEQKINVPNLTILDSSSNTILFPNNRAYLLQRNYEVRDEAGAIIQNKTIDYLLRYNNGQIFMGFDENASKKFGPKIILNEQNISQNCSKMQFKGDPDRPLPVCIECVNFEKYYLRNYSEYETEVKICVRRKKILPNCRQYEMFSEYCEICDLTYFLYTDIERQTCFKTIPFCKSHRVESPNIICQECQEGYIFKNSECVLKTNIQNCKEADENHCLICEEGYFLFGNACINKIGYSFFGCPLNQQGACLCGASALQVSGVSECVRIKQDNCVEYFNESTCTKCRDGFYLNASGICLNGEIPFCNDYGEMMNGMQICADCLEGYVLENNTCREVIPLFSNKCVEKKGENCLKCEPSSYRLSFSETAALNDNANSVSSIPTNLQICTENVFFNSYDNARNCLFFNQEDNRCELCQEGLWVQSNGSCGACDLTTSAIDRTNTECITPAQFIPGCELYYNDLCVKCLNMDKPVILHAQDYTEGVRTYTNRQLNQFTEKPHFVINECEVELDESCNLDFCRNALILDDGRKCCQTCKFTRTGAWVKENENYYTKSCSDVIDYCDGSVKFSGIPIEFELYLTCHECLENRIININNTEGMIQSSCVQRDVNKPNHTNCQILYQGECLICKPKTRKIVDEDENILRCEVIENCEASTAVQKCEKCKSRFSLDSLGEYCYPNTTAHCHRMNEEFQCVECIDGMMLYQNNCFELPPSNCLAYKNQNCVSCNPNTPNAQPGQSINLLININFQFQNPFTYSQKSMCLTPSTNSKNPIIPNCNKYSSFNICLECQSSYILKDEDDKKICVQNTNTTNFCRRINNQNRCVQCDDGKYLESDRCFDGGIQGCKEYVDQMNCKECSEDFVLLTKGNRKMCFYEYKVENCAKTLSRQSPDGSIFDINCLKCESNFRRNQLVFSRPVCYPLRFMKNCKKINLQTNMCDICDDLYFLNSSNICTRRINLSIKFCQKLDPGADNCQQCMEGYDLSSNRATCSIKKSSSIPGCKIQNSVEKGCLVCENDFFLRASDSSCQKVSQNINNCAKYLTKSICMMCKIGYLLKQSAIGQTCEPNTLSSYSNLVIFSTSNRIDTVTQTTAISSNKKSINFDANTAQPISSNDIKVQSSNAVVSQNGQSNKKTSFNELSTPRNRMAVQNAQIGFDEDEFNQPRLLEKINQNLYTNKSMGNLNYSIISDGYESDYYRILQSDGRGNILRNSALKRVCGLCEEGYVYSASDGKCVKVGVEGCLVASGGSCLICMSKRFQNEKGNCIQNLQSGLGTSVSLFSGVSLSLLVLALFQII